MKIMETSIGQAGSIERRKLTAGLVLSVKNVLIFNSGEEFSGTQDHLKGSFELNYCPECGRDLRKENTDGK
jgi:hypothetical protein